MSTGRGSWGQGGAAPALLGVLMGSCCSPRREEPQGSGVVLRRDLLFSSFSARDLRTNFTCVVLSPIGLDTRELRWGPPQPAPTESRELG